jgi:hypothetical protein
METLTQLITNPLDAVSGLVEAVLPATPTGTAAGAPCVHLHACVQVSYQ